MPVNYEAHKLPVSQSVQEFITLDQAAFDAQKEGFVANRIHDLEQQTQSPATVDSLSDRYSGFIGSHTEVKVSPAAEGFRLDDPEMYTSLIDHSRNFFRVFQDTLRDDPNNDMAFFKAALYATQQTQEEYFGNASPTAEQSAAHDVLVNRASGVNSVADFKNIALCVQRSAAANNMLQVLGVNTALAYGELSLAGDQPFGHTFLLVKTPKGGTRLYDPMNPTHFYDAGQRTSSRPRYPKVPTEIEASSGYYETDIQARFQKDGENKIVKVPAVYHLEANKEEVLAMMRLREMLSSVSVKDTVSLGEGLDSVR